MAFFSSVKKDNLNLIESPNNSKYFKLLSSFFNSKFENVIEFNFIVCTFEDSLIIKR